MNLPLKYLLPTLLLITGFFLVSVQTYIQRNSEYAQMIKNATDQASITGNRLASRITYEVKSGTFSEQKMVSLSAPYMADTLDQLDIYDHELNPMFSRFVPSYANDKLDNFESSRAYKVIKEQFSDILYKEQSKHIVAYFPIDLPVQKGEVLSRSTGVLHLVFDITQAYNQAKEGVIKTAIMNVIIVTTMVLFFSMLMYYLIFKRLNALHKATLMLADGDFNVHVETKGEDELTQVIQTFNSMAVDINAYIHDMEEQIEKAVKEQHEHSKIMIQQSRLASMGEMIGNIAHQWRQPLNALSLVIQKIELFSNRGKLTQEVITESVQKATGLIENMSTTIDDFRDFFKPDKKMEYFGLMSVVNDVLSLQSASLKEENISIDIKIDESLSEIYGFKNEFAQVIINLINNAKDALIENQIVHKEIFIGATQHDAQVIFTLSDNAGGIPEGIIDRIFEPYYTTKEEGKGTGIGLYMSKMIIEENMQGTIRVKNNGSGAEFSMIFNNIKGQQ